jgi:hypothetical protein
MTSENKFKIYMVRGGVGNNKALARNRTARPFTVNIGKNIIYFMGTVAYHLTVHISLPFTSLFLGIDTALLKKQIHKFHCILSVQVYGFSPIKTTT